MAAPATDGAAHAELAASTGVVTIGLLGPTAVSRNAVDVAPGPLRQRALLALLALNARRPVVPGAIVDALWGDDLPDRPEVSVRSYVSNLRRLLEPDRPPRGTPGLLVTDGRGYRLEITDDDVDALRFATLTAEAARADHAGHAAAALEAADTALRRWRGPPLVDLQGVPFAVGVATRLEADRDRVEVIRLRALVDLGRHGEAVGPLETRLAADPFDEVTAGLLMRALYALGRPADALSRYGDVRRGLAERGLLPSPMLQDVERAVLQHDLPAAVVTLPTVPSPSPCPDAVVGRRDAWSRIVASVDRSEPLTTWTVVRGESGIGKTFLLEALARAFDGNVLWGRGHRDDDQPPLALWHGVLDELTVEPVTDLTRLATQIRDRLHAATADRRVLVVLDDVQWADADSRRVLRLVATETRRIGVTFLIAARTTDGSDDLRNTFADIMRQPDTTVIDLEPFAAEEVSVLASNLGVELSAVDASTLLAASGGNPLLVRELLRLPVERRSGPLPREIAALVAARLERLPSGTLGVLNTAALAGDTLDVELLARALGLDAETVLDRLDPAVGAGILDPATMRFRHVAVRDAVLLDVAPAGLRRLHLRLADVMAADSGRWAPARLVHHLASARPLGDVDALLVAVRRAAAAATAVGAFAEQARLLGVALADDALDAKVRLELTIDAAEACGRAGDDLDAQAHALAALELAEVLGDRDGAARTVAVIGRGGGAWYWVPFGQHPDELLARIERAAMGAEGADRSLILATLAVGESYGPDRSRPARLAAEALEVADRANDPVARGEALIAASWIGFGVAPADELLRLADELDALDGVLPPERQMACAGFRLAAALRQSDLATAAAALNRGEALARTHRRPAFDATFAWARATLLAVGGELRAAGDAAGRAHELHARTQVYGAALARDLVAIHHLDQGGDLALAGDPADAVAGMDDHGDLYQLRVAAARGVALDLPAIEARLATVLAEPPAWHRTSRLGVIGSLAADVGLQNVGREIARALSPYAGELIVVGTGLVCAGPVGLVLARLDALDGRPHDAVDRLRAAVDAARTTGLRGWEAPLLVELADLLHSGGDRDDARAAARRARTLATRVGQPGIAARAARHVDR